MQALQPENGPHPSGAYVPGIQAGGLVFVSGQGPFDPGTGDLVAEDLEGQVRATLANVERVVQSAGGSLHDIVRVDAFLADCRTSTSTTASIATPSAAICRPAPPSRRARWDQGRDQRDRLRRGNVTVDAAIDGWIAEHRDEAVAARPRVRPHPERERAARGRRAGGAALPRVAAAELGADVDVFSPEDVPS